MVTRRSGFHEAPSGGDDPRKQDNIQTVPVLKKIAEQARLRPEATALHFGASDLSYAELQSRMAQLAAYLGQKAKTSNGAVAICLERSSDWVIAALAIMRSGAAYVPLDPAWPEARVRYAIEASGAVALVARGSMIDDLQLSIPAIDPLRDAAAIAKTPPLPADEIAPESLAYIIYTSGSTGTPKGVEITHANLAHLIEWHCEAFAVTADDKASHLAGVAFDASAWELWPSLCVGAQICIPDDTVLLSPDLVRSWMLRERVTIGFVPSLYAAHMMEMEWPASTALRFLLTGGDVLPQGPKKGLPFAVVNNYGPTECTVVATSTILRAGASETPPIGKPITGTTVYLLDEDQKKVPDGFPGEIYIGGDKVARGYRNQPELTRERFIADPFASNTNARLYRTGDRGELRPDGQIHFLGRLDRQTKIRGKRLELEEVGSVLSRHPNISMATVVAASEPGKDDKRLIAYVVFKHPEFTASRDELASHLSQHLPEYMVPAAFVRLEQMPLTLNGKLDFTALPALSDANELKSAPKQKPATSLEQRLLAIIEDLLHGKSIGIDDNVFLAGGDSLLGMQLIMELKQTFQVELRFDQIFEAPTVRDLAALIGAQASGNAEVTAPIEQQLLIIIQDLLHGKSISVNDNVFLAGGDSLLGMQLMIELKEKFKIDLRFDQIFEAATVHDLARLIQNMQKAPPSAQNSAGFCTPMALTGADRCRSDDHKHSEGGPQRFAPVERRANSSKECVQQTHLLGALSERQS